jgi:DNA-binding MarR family transcriptional regulator
VTDDERILSGEAIRRLLYRRDVAVARHRSALARTLGITDVEMQALVHLAEQDALSPSAIGALLDLSSGGATALVQRLEQAGHVTRKPHPSDRRSTLIQLAARTAERLERAESKIVRGLDSVTRHLTEPERIAVSGVLIELVTLSEQLEVPVRRHESAGPRPVPGLWA